jgi:hypothetical protein
VRNKALHRNTSHVMEKALMHCSSDDQHALITQLCEPSTVVSLAQSQFGSFVFRSLIDHPSVDSKSIRGIIAQNMEEVRSTKFGKRLVDELGLAPKQRVASTCNCSESWPKFKGFRWLSHSCLTGMKSPYCMPSKRVEVAT